jgi:hypothetical protein
MHTYPYRNNMSYGYAVQRLNSVSYFRNEYPYSDSLPLTTDPVKVGRYKKYDEFSLRDSRNTSRRAFGHHIRAQHLHQSHRYPYVHPQNSQFFNLDRSLGDTGGVLWIPREANRETLLNPLPRDAEPRQPRVDPLKDPVLYIKRSVSNITEAFDVQGENSPFVNALLEATLNRPGDGDASFSARSVARVDMRRRLGTDYRDQTENAIVQTFGGRNTALGYDGLEQVAHNLFQNTSFVSGLLVAATLGELERQGKIQVSAGAGGVSQRMQADDIVVLRAILDSAIETRRTYINQGVLDPHFSTLANFTARVGGGAPPQQLPPANVLYGVVFDPDDLDQTLVQPDARSTLLQKTSQIMTNITASTQRLNAAQAAFQTAQQDYTDAVTAGAPTATINRLARMRLQALADVNQARIDENLAPLVRQQLGPLVAADETAVTRCAAALARVANLEPLEAALRLQVTQESDDISAAQKALVEKQHLENVIAQLDNRRNGVTAATNDVKEKQSAIDDKNSKNLPVTQEELDTLDEAKRLASVAQTELERFAAENGVDVNASLPAGSSVKQDSDALLQRERALAQLNQQLSSTSSQLAVARRQAATTTKNSERAWQQLQNYIFNEIASEAARSARALRSLSVTDLRRYEPQLTSAIYESMLGVAAVYFIGTELRALQYPDIVLNKAKYPRMLAAFQMRRSDEASATALEMERTKRSLAPAARRHLWAFATAPTLIFLNTPGGAQVQDLNVAVAISNLVPEFEQLLRSIR